MYYNMEVLVDKGILQYEVAKHLEWECRCGWAIVQTANSKHRKCSNPCCPVHLSHRADAIFKKFGYKDVGPRKAETIIFNNGLKSHFDILNKDLYTFDMSALGRQMWEYSQCTRQVYLHEIVMLASIPDVQEKAKQIFTGFSSFEQYFESQDYLKEYKDMLIGAQKYFTIIGSISQSVITAMATGSLAGYKNREHFFAEVNQMFAGRVYVDYKKHKNKSVDVLVCDDQSTDSPKLRAAKQNKIPIYTSSDFLLALGHTFGKV